MSLSCLRTGDSLSPQLSMGFTTIGVDNDNWPGNCAERLVGAWWFTNCGASDLNGVFYTGSCPHQEGVYWSTWQGSVYSVKSAMKIKPYN